MQIALSVVLFALVASVEGQQQPKKIYRTGYLSGTDRATDFPIAEGIRLALREVGYIEGKNIAIEYRHADGKRSRASEFLAELLRLNVDLIIVSAGDPWIEAAKNATKTIPIILAGQGSDPVKAGFIESLARPGGNITGFTSLTNELGGKRLEVFKEAVPKLGRVAVLYGSGLPGTSGEVKEHLPIAVRSLGLSMRTWELRTVDDFDKVFAALNKERPDGIYVPGGGSLMRLNTKRVTDFALKARLPSMYSRKESVDAGGLMAYGTDRADTYRRIAYYVDRVLKGAKPADLPVEQPTKFEFVINLNAAKQIGLTIPPNVLARADKVIR